MMQATSLYESAPRIQARSVWGRFARLRVLAMCALLGIYYLVPWIQVGGEPLVLFNLQERRFHLFTLTFVPQDLLYMTWLLVLMALTLFLFTTLAGRLFCGYACPQTVWTEAFLWMERLIEGDHRARQKLDRMPWSRPQKLLRRGARHLAWVVFALFTGLTFVSYFLPAHTLFPAAFAADLAGWPLFWTLFYAVATWGNAGFMREQVCKYMCPYARFQSAMFDRDTLIISYDGARGEPRKALARQQGVPAGDCISCSICVQVCPAGIDIRDGLQYECIACAACIDACSDVMHAVGKAPDLIHYSTRNQDEGMPARVLRPRLVGYLAVWALLGLGFLAALAMRPAFTLDVIRDRTHLYRDVGLGRVENNYLVKVTNKQDHGQTLQLTVSGNNGLYEVSPAQFAVAGGETAAVTVTVTGEKSGVALSKIQFVLQSKAGEAYARRKATFITGSRL